jgi:uncharacterized membrane protein YvbJ
MAFCGNCGNELREGAKFCPKCGTAANTHQEQQEAKGKRFSTPWIAAFAVLTILIGSYFVTDMVSPETHDKLFGWVSFGGSPTTVANNAMECFKTKDFSKFYDYVYIDDNLSLDEQKQMRKKYSDLMSKVMMALNIIGGIQDYEIVNEKIEKDKATITYKITYANGDIDDDFGFNLVKNKKGEWKIKFKEGWDKEL